MTVYGKYFSQVYDDRWSFWGPKMWPELSRALRLHAPGAKTWLDLCCGGGSLLRFVCRGKFQAVGVDRSAAQLAFARKNAPQARYVRSDIRELILGVQFDVITCMFDSLNYLDGPADLLKVFRRVRRHLTPGGLFAFDMNTFAGLQRNWNHRTSAMHSPGRTIVLQTDFDDAKAQGKLVITGFVAHKGLFKRFREVHIERGYTDREIERILRQARLSMLAKKDGNTLSRAKESSARLLYFCKAMD
jgi:SAM-dependent methyltransferase